MPDIDVAKLSPVDLRKVWPKEAADFTPWLASNLDRLGAELGVDLELVDTEAQTGSFSVDIRATDTNGNSVIIENQLERTDHDHLGKVLTYAAGHDAGVVVWIAKEMREEHRQAFDWLNQRTGSETEFYGVVVRAVNIDSSRPACLFDVVAQPNESRKNIVDSGGNQPSEHGEWRIRFWRLVLGRLRGEYQLTNRRRATRKAFINIPAEIQGVEYHAFVSDENTRAEFWLRGPDRARNEELFDLLKARKSEIEGSFGEPLVWERRNPWGTAPWICVYWGDRIDYADEALTELADWMVERVVKFSQKLTPIVRELAAEIDSETPDTELDAGTD